MERKPELHFRTATTVVESGKARVIVVESRRDYAVVKLTGARKKYPISWEQIFHIAERNHAQNLRLESKAAKQLAQRDLQKASKQRQTSTLKSKSRADPSHLTERNDRRESR